MKKKVCGVPRGNAFRDSEKFPLSCDFLTFPPVMAAPMWRTRS